MIPQNTPSATDLGPALTPTNPAIFTQPRNEVVVKVEVPPDSKSAIDMMNTYKEFMQRPDRSVDSKEMTWGDFPKAVLDEAKKNLPPDLVLDPSKPISETLKPFAEKAVAGAGQTNV